MPRPSCCKSDIQENTKWTSLLVQIVFVLNNIICLLLILLNCVEENKSGICTYIIGEIIALMINGLLFYGAQVRNNSLILVWIVLAVIECIRFFVVAILLLISISYVGVTHPMFVVLIIFHVAGMLFIIWALSVAKIARKEISDGTVVENGQEIK